MSDLLDLYLLLLWPANLYLSFQNMRHWSKEFTVIVYGPFIRLVQVLVLMTYVCIAVSLVCLLRCMI